MLIALVLKSNISDKSPFLKVSVDREIGRFTYLFLVTSDIFLTSDLRITRFLLGTDTY